MGKEKQKKQKQKQTTEGVSFMNSIKTKLILVMTLLIVIPLVISLIVSTVNTMSEGLETVDEINDAQASIVEGLVSSVLDQNVQALNVLATSPATVEFIEDAGTDAELRTELTTQMQAIDANFADGNSTVITGPDGQQLLRSVGDPVNVADCEYFQKAINGTIYVSDIQVSKSTGSRIITLAVPVYDSTHTEIIGIVQRNYDLSDFHDLFAAELTEERQEIVMVDRTGSVIAHSSHEISADSPEDQSGNAFYTDSRGDALTGSYSSTWQGDTWLISWTKEPKTGFVVASCRIKSIALHHVYVTAGIMVGLTILFAIIGIVIAFILAKSFTDPVKAINESLSALADGRFVRVDKFANRKDEFGVMVKNSNSVIDRLQSIVSGIKNSAAAVGTSSGELADTADQISHTADDVSNAVQDIASGATQQADEIQHASENTNRISDNIESVTNNGANLADTASIMNTDSKESANELDRLTESSHEMSDAIELISEKIGATQSAVESINEKVAAIDSISSQTSLLALNASIEAARAGEAGRGFAVVAEEIGKLADDSAKSASEIRQVMDTLLAESQEAVRQADEVKKSTEEQRTIIANTVESIQKLIEGIETTVAGVDRITSDADACNDSKIVIVDAMNSLSAISQQNAAATEETSASMEELNATVNTLAEAADSLKQISEELIEEMSFFKD